MVSYHPPKDTCPLQLRFFPLLSVLHTRLEELKDCARNNLFSALAMPVLAPFLNSFRSGSPAPSLMERLGSYRTIRVVIKAKMSYIFG